MTAQLDRTSATRRRCTPPGGAPAGSWRSPARRSPGRSNCRPGEVVFTSGGTESDNLALKGLFWSRRDADPRRTRILATVDRAPRRARPAALAGRARGRRGRAAARRRARPPRRRRAPRRGRARPRQRRAGLGDVGQQRGRHPPADRRGRRARARRTASRCTPTPSRRSARCPVDFAARGVDALTLTGAQGRRPVRRRRARRTPRARRHPAAPRRRPGARHPLAAPSTPRPSPASPRAVELAVKRQPEHAARVAALRDELVAGLAGAGARRAPQRRPGDGARPPAARQRPPDVPRLRGRLAADAARRPRHRVLDRLGLLGRRAPALPRAAGDGPRRRAGPQLAAVLARPHQHRGRRRRPGRGDRPGRGAGPRRGRRGRLRPR